MMGFKIKKTVNGETVWQPIKAKKYTTSKIAEYTGSLPITITASGDVLLDYRIYGADGGVGEPTENLFEVESDMLSSLNWDLNPSYGPGGLSYFINYKLSDAVTQELKKGQHTCSIFRHFTDGYIPRSLVCAFTPTISYTVASEYRILTNNGITYTRTFDFSGWPDIYLIIGYGDGFATEEIWQSKISELFANWGISIVAGSIAPTKYEPYGYKLPMTVSDENTTQSVPVYIGENQLTKNEYVSYGERKVYKYMVPENAGNTVIYGFHINPDDSDPSSAVTYLEDAVGMTPASMGSTVFNYGSWQNVFFIPKPCMLKFDGTVDYYLDPNDYSKKDDGTPSDYNNLSYGGNAMMEFPLIWYKFVPGAAEGEGCFYCSNHKVDDTYKCWSNMDCDGNIIEHFYMPIYNGCTYDGKMRSISGLTLAAWSSTAYSASATYTVGNKINYDGKMWQCTTAVETAEAFDPTKWEQFAFNGNTIATEEIAQATANNTTEKNEWYIDQWCDRVLINGLLVLISKSIDTQGTFGRGVGSGGQAVKESYVTGSLDNKGLFYGSAVNGTTAVKVFGMENWWGLVWHRTAGLIGGATNTYLYKMTFSTADGSIVDGYNTSGTGYPSVGGKPTVSNYIKKMQFGLFGFLPIEVGSYSAQYYKNYYYNGTGFARFGGDSYGGAFVGAFYVNLFSGAEYRTWNIGAAPSCKPLAKLSPTEPPVSLPKIPTIDGTTIIDYDGTPKPSQMYIKYKSWSGWSDIDNYKMVNGNWTQEVT